MIALLPKPSAELIRELGNRFDDDRDTALAEMALSRLLKQPPHNEDFGDVVVKAATINALYSTRIYAIVALWRSISLLVTSTRSWPAVARKPLSL